MGARAHTCSIVARDAASGELGVAVQSHWFQVGTAVPWGEAGVGAVATQGFVRVAYGIDGLARLRAGGEAGAVLEELLADDPERDHRQVALVDAGGRAAAWTGRRCVGAAGHRVGVGYVALGNMMAGRQVWEAMGEAFEASAGKLSKRLLRALEGGEAAGGDVRGAQSAALVVWRAAAMGSPVEDRAIDLRVDDHPTPLAELRRLVRLHRVYGWMNRGDDALAEGRVAAALELYTRGAEAAPEIPELPFWQAVTLFSAGREEEALALFGEVLARDPRLARLVPQLPDAGLLPGERGAVERILATAPDDR